MSTKKCRVAWLIICLALLISGCSQAPAHAQVGVTNSIVLRKPVTSPLIKRFTTIDGDFSSIAFPEFACPGAAVLLNGRLLYIQKYWTPRNIPTGQDTTDILTYDGSGWARLPVPLTGAPGGVQFASQSAAYDPELHAIVMLAPEILPGVLHTWLFSGSSWKELTSVKPMTYSGIAMVFDPTAHEVILIGSRSEQATPDIWAFNGSAWMQLHPVRNLPPGARSNAVYDPVYGGVVIFDALPGHQHRLWIYRNATWSPLFAGTIAENRPSVLDGASLAYDETTRDLVLLGGGDGARDGIGTWMLSADGSWTWLRPRKYRLVGPFWCLVGAPAGIYAIGTVESWPLDKVAREASNTLSGSAQQFGQPALFVFRNDQWQQLCYQKVVSAPRPHMAMGCSNG
jgi:hypothetical protein